MKIWSNLLRGAILVLLLQSACQNPVDEGPQTGTPLATRLSGIVRRSDTGVPVNNVIVQDTKTPVRDTTRNGGRFSLTYMLPSPYSGTVIAQSTGFGTDSINVRLQPGVDDTSAVLTLKADSTSPVTGIGTGKPANIVVVSSEIQSIAIRGTGLNESALFVFEVRDSLGNPVVGVNKVTVKFSILGGPGGGEYVFPASGETNPTTGRVSTRLTSGTKPGVLQLNATTRNDSVKASPVRVTISGGLPDGNHISISTAKLNVAGRVFDNLRTKISVILADRFGNPVPPNTAVYFSTTGGTIQPTASTDKDGIAGVDLISGPNPPLNGIVTVRAQTVGDTSVSRADSVISKTIRIIFSGPTILSDLKSTVSVADSGIDSLKFKVADANGNPLSAGTTIKVEKTGDGAGAVELLGDVNRTVPDTQDTTSFTTFTVYARKPRPSSQGGYFNLLVQVKSPNGDVDPPRAYLGYVGFAGGGAGGFGGAGIGQTSTLTLLNTAPIQLTVKGTASNDNARVSFIARDSLGNPIASPLDPTKKAYVTFSIVSPLGGGEFVFPTLDSTNASGVVSTSIFAGTKSGIIQIRATTIAGSRTIIASANVVISGGFPDSTHFTAFLSRTNLPGLVMTGNVGTLTVQLGDKFGNPVHPTLVYFGAPAPAGGIVQPSALTDNAGQATVSLQGGAPAPNDPTLGGIGFGAITLNTFGENGLLTQKVPFLFSGAPVISVPLYPTGTLPTINEGGFVDVEYVVADTNGNPICGGNRIVVEVSGEAKDQVVMSGDIDFIMVDTQDKINGTRFRFKASDKFPSGGTGGFLDFAIKITGESGNVTKTLNGFLLAPGVAGGGAGGSGYAWSVLLKSVSTTDLSVQGTGNVETAALLFESRDSLGAPVDQTHASMMKFTVTSPTLGARVSVDSVLTDASGRATTLVQAGTIAGVIQVVASTTVNGRTMKGSANVVISGGPPDSTHFTVWADKLNWPGIVSQGIAIGTVSVQVGDKYANPAQPNTALYFTSNAGIIDPSGFTDATGHASAILYGGNPIPPQGLDTITVTTVGENGVNLKKIISVAYSGSPLILVPAYDPKDTLLPINANGILDVSYAVADLNSNPLAAGNSVTVTASGDAASKLSLSRDISVTTTDSKTKITGTPYSFRITNNVPSGGTGGTFTITITVNGPNGSEIKRLYGTLLAPAAVVPPSPTARKPAQIAFLSISTSDLFVAGVGGTENAVIAYQVKDSLGQPIDKSLRTYATFTPNFFANSLVSGGTSPRLIPNADSTDDQGQLHVSVVSGSQAGVVQVVANIQLGGGVSITSQPVRISVHAGFADRGHFSLRPAHFVFPGIDYTNTVTFTAAVGDTFSNPVPQGTDVYFHSMAGYITTGLTTDVNGFVNNTLYTVNPVPEAGGSTLAGRPTYDATFGPGYTWVYAQTKGNYNTSIEDSVLVVWTKAPITVTGISGATVVSIPTGGTSAPLSFTVKDGNGNPLPDGTTVGISFVLPQTTVQLAFSAAGDFTAQNPATIPNAAYARFPGTGITDFTIRITDASNPAAPTTISIGIVITISAPGIGTKQVSFTGDIN